MASSSTSGKVEPDADDGVIEEETEMLQHFDDFTIASSWERFISEIEAVCRIWIADGPKRLLEKGAVLLGYSKNSYKVKSELKYGMKSYCMEYYFESNSKGKPVDWRSAFHDLQLCFGVKEFLVIAPQTASSVVLDAPEASKLLSAVAIALSNCSSLWPAFVPVHDPSRKAYIGIQNMGTVFTRRFEADQIGSQVPIRLMHLEGLYELFVSKFAYTTLDLSTHLSKVQFEMKLTYRILPYDDDNIKDIHAENTKSGENLTSEMSSETLWDNDCPWSEWYSAEDPIKGFELITIWSEKMVESSMEMAELENASPYEAEKWLISPSCAPKLYGFFVIGIWITEILMKRSCNRFEEPKWTHTGFAYRLHLLVDALQMSFEAKIMESFVSGENTGSENLKFSMVIPPPTVRDQVLKELFQEGIQFTDSAYGGHKISQAIKGAPLESLFAQFCLHSLWFGDCNIHAIAVLWIEFVREVRRCWEESKLVPWMPANGSIDLSTCLINQKLQMLAACVEKKCEMNENYQDCIGSEDHIESMSMTEVLYYLETLQPHQLLEQMVCTAFKAAADTLIQTSYGDLKHMETLMQQLYLTMAPALKPLQVNGLLSADTETLEDLRRLCVVFQHVEKLLTFAASLHRKFLRAPRLAREIFSDFYNFYIPRMGIGLTEDTLKKEFDKKQEVWNTEREVLSNILVQPTANQSWRKVLSMGNLLNGHEPILREIIFSLHDGVNGNHYATHTTSVSQQNIETYRMYICGTSNDLRVALSVVSCD